MKKILYFLTITAMATAMTTMSSCKKDDGPEPINENNFPVPAMAEHAVKVNITTSDAPYTFFEATEGGRFIVGKSDGTYITGSYTVTDNVYTLQGFGKVKVVKTKAEVSVIYLTFLPNEAAEVHVEGIPATPVTDNDSKNLCRLWNVTKTRIALTDAVNVAAEFQGCDLNAIEEFITQYVELKKHLPTGMNVTGVTFTSMSTYMIEYSAHPADIGSWNWNDSSHDTLKYKWKSEAMGYEWENGSAKIEYSENTLIFTGDVDLKDGNKNYHVNIYMAMVPKN